MSGLSTLPVKTTLLFNWSYVPLGYHLSSNSTQLPAVVVIWPRLRLLDIIGQSMVWNHGPDPLFPTKTIEFI